MSGIEMELVAATRTLHLARYRVEQYRRAFGDGRVERDLSRRLRDALAAVRALEVRAA